MEAQLIVSIILLMTAMTTAQQTTTTDFPTTMTVFTSTSTEAPTTSTTPPTTVVRTTTTEATSTSTAPTTTSTTEQTTSTSTAAPTTVTTTAGIVSFTSNTSVITIRVIFRSAQDTFTFDLLNSESAAFITRRDMIVSVLTPLFRAAYPGFVRLEVIEFRPGSVINIAECIFEENRVPTKDAIVTSLISFAPLVTGFDIDTSSITINGTVFINGTIATNGTSTSSAIRVHHNFSFITAVCFFLLPWLFFGQQ